MTKDPNWLVTNVRPAAKTIPAKMTTTISEAMTAATLDFEPPILKRVSISRRLRRSDNMNTSAADANCRQPNENGASNDEPLNGKNRIEELVHHGDGASHLNPLLIPLITSLKKC